MGLGKVCKGCGCEKPLTDYPKQSKAKDGLYPYCKGCACAKTKAWAASLPPIGLRNAGTHKVCTTCKVEQPIEEYYVKHSTKDGRSWICKGCSRAKALAWTAANAERIRQRLTAERIAINARSRERKRRNPEKIKAQWQRYYEQNRQKVQAANKRWLDANPGYALNKCRKYQMHKRQRALRGNHWRELRDIYASAPRLTDETGIVHHVDHIIPLQSRLVCGLHVPANLQVIPAEANQRKGNSFAPIVINDPSHPWLQSLPRLVLPLPYPLSA